MCLEKDPRAPLGPIENSIAPPPPTPQNIFKKIKERRKHLFSSPYIILKKYTYLFLLLIISKISFRDIKMHLTVVRFQNVFAKWTGGGATIYSTCFQYTQHEY